MNSVVFTLLPFLLRPWKLCSVLQRELGEANVGRSLDYSKNLFLKLNYSGSYAQCMVLFWKWRTGLASASFACLLIYVSLELWIPMSPLSESNVLTNILLVSESLFLEVWKDLLISLYFSAKREKVGGCSFVLSSSKFSLSTVLFKLVEVILQLSWTFSTSKVH